MECLLDTHALLWWFFDNPKLSRDAYRQLKETDIVVFVSAATAWEIATKVRLGKLDEAKPLIADYDRHLATQNFQTLSITSSHARRAGGIAAKHKDPFDRLIAAQAQAEDIPVVTCDPAFAMLGVRVFW